MVLTNELGYVADLDVEAITHALDRYLTDPTRAQQMGIRARQFTVENYNWERIATDLIRVYQTIVDRQPLPKMSRTDRMTHSC